jgi:hypothetical protein
MDISTEKVVINNVTYVREDQIKGIPIPGTRAIVVVDRGWIFAGNVSRENGRIRISNALHVFQWEGVGFAGIVQNAKKADLRPIADVDLPSGSEIFCVPVNDSWGK